MRIVQLANLVTPTSGGIRTVLDRLGHGYAEDGHDVHRIVPGERDAVEVTPAGTVHVLRGARLPLSGGYRMLVRRRPVVQLLDDLEPDRLEVSDRFTLAWVGHYGRHRNIPSMVIVHERLIATLRTWLPFGVGAGPVARSADRRLVRSFDHVVVPSRFAAAAFPGVPNVQVVPLGVDLGIFRPHPTATLGAGPVRLIAVTRLSREKRPATVIDAVAHLVSQGLDVELTVVGDGPLRPRLERRASGLPVRFAGFVPDRQRLASMVADATFAVATCPIETFGLSALEALACGTPVVAAAGGALPELVAGDVGIVVEPTGETIAGAVRRLLERDLGAMRAAARARAEAYPWSRARDRMLALHEAPTSHPFQTSAVDARAVAPDRSPT